jgi:hypothetical protein
MSTTDDALDLLGGLTDHVGPWWASATPLQQRDAQALLNLDGPRRHWLGRAKGYSKTRDVAAVSMVVLLTQMAPGERAYCAASDADQAGLIRQSIAGFYANTPGLRDDLVVESRRIIAPKSDTELIILAADSAGSHGLRPKWLVVDELANWPDVEGHREFFDNLWAGLPKAPDSRGVIITTAGSPGHFSRKIFEAAQRDKLWRVSDVHGPPPWTDPGEVESERRRQMPSKFARFWLNEWTSADDAIAEPADVEAACTLKGPLAPESGLRYLCTLDLGHKHDRTVAVIAHPQREGEGTRVVVDRMKVWTPRFGSPVSLDEVRQWLVEFCRLYRAPLLYDPSQAYLMVEQLRRAGLTCREFVFGTASVGLLATAIMQALRGRLLTLPDDEELKSEILNVRLRETSVNVIRIDHKSGRHDDRVIAIAMAVHDLTSKGLPGGRPVLFTDEDIMRQDLAEARALGKAPEAVPLLGRAFGGDTSMPADVHRDDEDEEAAAMRGKTMKSPFVQ